LTDTCKRLTRKVNRLHPKNTIANRQSGIPFGKVWSCWAFNRISWFDTSIHLITRSPSGQSKENLFWSSYLLSINYLTRYNTKHLFDLDSTNTYWLDNKGLQSDTVTMLVCMLRVGIIFPISVKPTLITLIWLCSLKDLFTEQRN
jgi:hypothetical protein